MDTNVLLAAHISQSGASHKILRLITNEKINLALSTATPGLFSSNTLNLLQKHLKSAREAF